MPGTTIAATCAPHALEVAPAVARPERDPPTDAVAGSATSATALAVCATAFDMAALSYPFSLLVAEKIRCQVLEGERQLIATLAMIAVGHVPRVNDSQYRPEHLLAAFESPMNLLEVGYQTDLAGNPRALYSDQLIMEDWPDDGLSTSDRALILSRYHRARELQRAWNRSNAAVSFLP